MRKTGRKDKNGREIYEGDILKITHHFYTGGTGETTGIVKYSNPSFILDNRRYKWPNPPANDITDLNYYLSFEVEIISETL